MLTQIEKQQFRCLLFRHLDGIVMAPAAFALHEKEVLAYLLNNKTVSLKEITEKFNANEGYLNAALRLLCSYGWLVQSIDNENDIKPIDDYKLFCYIIFYFSCQYLEVSPSFSV